MKKIRFNEWILAIIISVLYAGINSLEVIVRWFKNPPGTIFVGIAHYYADFFLYVAQMREGADGHLWYIHRFTDELVKSTWIYWFNNLLGWLGHALGLAPYVTYNWSLLILATGLALLVFYVFRLIYTGSTVKRWLGFIFFLFAAPLIDLPALLKSATVKLPDYLWFSPMLPLNRFGGVPHQIWQTILLIFMTLSFINLIKPNKSPGAKTIINYSIFIILTILTTSANPATMLIFIISAVVLCLGQTFKSKSLRPLVPLLILGAFSLPAALITNYEFDASPIFTASKIWELKQYVDRDFVDFLLAIGPLVIFIFTGLISRKSHKPLELFLIIVSLISIVFFFSNLPAVLGITPPRYLSPFGYLGLIILGLDGIFAVAKAWPGYKLEIIFGILVLLLSLPAIFIQVLNRSVPANNPYQLLDTFYNHLPESIGGGLIFLGQQPDNPRRPVVLVDPNFRVEVLVPAFADKTVFSGHPIHTLNPDLKENMRNTFFNAGLSEAEAEKFLTDHRIGYIITGSNFRPYFSNFPFIQEIFHNSVMLIYKVK